MSKINKDLYKYYKKNISSFVAHLNKANSIDEKNIHKLRVDIKRIRAILNLLEMVTPEKFKAENYSDIFSSIFKQAGKIRKLQVNFFYLAKYKLPYSTMLQYGNYLLKKEKEDERSFEYVLKKFNKSAMNNMNKQVEKLCKKISPNKIIRKLQNFIEEQSKGIKKLIKHPNYENSFHKIRIHLKSILAITYLLYKLNPNKQTKKSLIKLKATSELIGDWHDKSILTNSLGNFLKKSFSADKYVSLEKLKKKIIRENNLMERELKNNIRAVLLVIRYSFSSKDN